MDRASGKAASLVSFTVCGVQIASVALTGPLTLLVQVLFFIRSCI